MGLIILSWIYISVIFFSLGLLCLNSIEKVVKFNLSSKINDQEMVPVSFLLTGGLIFTMVLACLYSLYRPLSYEASIFLFLIAAFSLVINRAKVKSYLTFYRMQILDTSLFLIVFYVAFILILAYFSADQSSHFDDGLYYSTTIKWAEEFGTVKGLANINPRIGFNSNWHLLHALFSFQYLDLGNFNDLNGLLILIMFPYSLGGLNKLIRSDYRIVTVIRSFFLLPVLPFYFGSSHDFIFYNINFISSSSADIVVCVLLWAVIIWVFELDFFNSEILFDRQSIYIVLVSCFLFTVKASAAPVLLTTVWFLIKFIKQKKYSLGCIIILFGVVIIGPWIIRNVLISGYLIFPLSSIDLFNIDWKIPLHHAIWHENAIKVYAINPEYDLNKPFTIPLTKWFPIWFNRLTFIQSLMFLASVLFLIIFSLVFLVNAIKKGRIFFSIYAYRIFAFLITVVGLLLWFFKGPDFRFGFGFIGILCVFSLSLGLKYFLENGVKYFGYILLACMTYIFFFYYSDVWKSMPKRLFKLPAERRMPSSYTTIISKNGVKINLVSHYDSWYAPLPVSNSVEYYSIFPALRGNTVKDGFKASIKIQK